MDKDSVLCNNSFFRWPQSPWSKASFQGAECNIWNSTFLFLWKIGIEWQWLSLSWGNELTACQLLLTGHVCQAARMTWNQPDMGSTVKCPTVLRAGTATAGRGGAVVQLGALWGPFWSLLFTFGFLPTSAIWIKGFYAGPYKIILLLSGTEDVPHC